MVICPKCKEEIQTLNNYQSGEDKFEFWVDDDEPQYQHAEFQADGKTTDYECPNCQETLFNNEEEATEFLKGQDELQQIVAEKLKQIKENKKC